MKAFMLIVAVASLAALAVVAPATATRPNTTPVAGEWSITSGEVVEQRQVGQLLYLRQRGTAAFFGDLAGSTTFDLRAFVRPDFSSFGWATEVFTGTVGGRSGTLLLLERATGGADGSARIDAVVVGRTGGLRGVHGHMTFVSDLCIPETCGGTYSGALRGLGASDDDDQYGVSHRSTRNGGSSDGRRGGIYPAPTTRLLGEPIRETAWVRALIFDLDGTLVDTVYAHVFAWQRAFAEVGLPIDGWRIHRRIGMSGGLFARAAAREIGRPLGEDEVEALQRRHGELYRELLPERRPLPGAVELLAELRAGGIVHGIATSGRRPEIDASLEALGAPAETVVVARGDVSRAKPEPDLFLTCAERLGEAPTDCYVVGDAVWDLLAARRAGMLSIGLLSGGYGEDELTRAGAFRVYRDAAELRDSLDELGLVP